MSKALDDIAAERQRQIDVERYTSRHDDGHVFGELGIAAALYALPYQSKVNGELLLKQDDYIGLHMALDLACGWNLKPETDPRKRLVKAGALIIAEIERLDRSSSASQRDSQP